MKANARLVLARLAFAGFVFLARRGKDHLELEARRRLFDHLKRYPGLHLSEIARGVGLETNHTKYHLEYLEKHGLVSSRKEDGYWRFFPRTEGTTGMRDILSVEDKKLLSFLRRPVPLHVTLILMERGEATHGEISEEVDVSPATAHYHLKKMEGAALLESRKEGRSRFYWVHDPDRVLDLLIQYKPPDDLVSGFLEAWEQFEL